MTLEEKLVSIFEKNPKYVLRIDSFRDHPALRFTLTDLEFDSHISRAIPNKAILSANFSLLLHELEYMESALESHKNVAGK